MADTLPEGTDHIVPGAARIDGDDGATAGSAATAGKTAGGDLRDRIAAHTGEYRAQAEDKVRDYAVQGKNKASGALDEVARLIGDNARQIDDKVGSQYGDYARRAADAVSGAADTLRGKDIDELVEDARAVIRQSPGLAIGAAAAAGFMLARVLKSGSESLADIARQAGRTPGDAPAHTNPPATSA